MVTYIDTYNVQCIHVHCIVIYTRTVYAVHVCMRAFVCEFMCIPTYTHTRTYTVYAVVNY